MFDLPVFGLKAQSDFPIRFVAHGREEPGQVFGKPFMGNVTELLLRKIHDLLDRYAVNRDQRSPTAVDPYDWPIVLPANACVWSHFRKTNF